MSATKPGKTEKISLRASIIIFKMFEQYFLSGISVVPFSVQFGVWDFPIKDSGLAGNVCNVSFC